MLRFRCQFRRIVLTAALYTQALLLFAGARPALVNLSAPPGPAFAAVVFVLMLMVWAAVAALLAHFAPLLLGTMESSGLAMVTWVVLLRSPANLSLPVWGENLLAIALVVGFVFLLYGWPWRRLAIEAGPFRMSFDTALPPAKVWRRLFPDPAVIAYHVVPGARIEALPSGDFRLDYPRRSSPTGRQEELVRVEVCEPLQHYRIKYFAGEGLERIGLTPGQAIETQEVWLRPQAGGGTSVEMSFTIYNSPANARLNRWLSGWRRDTQAHFHSRIEGRPDPSLNGRNFDPPLPFPVPTVPAGR